MTSFRSVLERAMRELQADFTEIVERRLRALMDDDAPVAKAPTTTRAKPKIAMKTRAAKKPAVAAKPPRRARGGRPAAGRGRPSGTAIATALLDALGNGGEFTKGALMKAAGLGERESERVFAALASLRRSGQVTMNGSRGQATYRFAQTGRAAVPSADRPNDEASS
ncbi:MAG: hypothetical protein ACHREM_10745 [Polyangiales bacterium]